MGVKQAPAELSPAKTKRLKALARPKNRRQAAEVLVEGPQACREATAAGLVSELYLAADAAVPIVELSVLVVRKGGQAFEVRRQDIDAVSKAAQGVVAVAIDPWGGENGCAERWLESQTNLLVQQNWLVAVFEQIRDPGNAGTAIRAADAAGADSVIFSAGSVDPSSPKVIRASTGSYFHLPVLRADNLTALVSQLNCSGLTVLAADSGGKASLWKTDLSGPTAWLFGNEARGLTDQALAVAGRTVQVPIYGRSESLNLAMAATLCLYASANAHRALN
jgi:TrmH family RNA methyltransferase